MKKTDTVLDTIVAAKREYLSERKSSLPLDQIKRELSEMKPFKGPSFYDALKREQPSPKIIAEIKKASPSGGVLRDPFSLSEINSVYQSAPNVVAISVLTERKYFQGSEESLIFCAENNIHQKPLLRKDFIFDPYQVFESKLLGAQAYLLIASLFNKTELEELIAIGQDIGIEPLIEVHDLDELELAQSTTTRTIGVNCRDLKDFSIDTKAHELLRRLNDSYARVAESGIDSPKYLKYVADFSDAALVGGHFMVARQIESAIAELVTSDDTSQQEGSMT